MGLDIPYPINAAFEGYEQQVLAGASKDQRAECRLAFFAGAAVVLAHLNKIEDDDEEAAVALLDLINDELQQFGQSLDAEWMQRTSKGRMS
jgi:hypothetical protein